MARALPKSPWSPEPNPWVGLSLFLPLTLVLAGLVLYPVMRLLVIAMPDGPSLQSFADYFANAARLRAFVVTFRDSAAVAVSSVAMGFMLAWTATTTRSRLLKTIIWLGVALPFLMGTVVKNYALLILLARRGIINTLLTKSGLLDAPLPLLYNEIAVVVGILYTLLPYAVIPIFAALSTLDFDMVRAAESMGARRFAAIRTIVLPILYPVLFSTGMLIFVIAVGFYVVPVVLGGATSPFIATLIQNDLVQFFDLKSAAIAALVLVCLSMATVVLTTSALGLDQVNKATGAS